MPDEECIGAQKAKSGSCLVGRCIRYFGPLWVAKKGPPKIEVQQTLRYRLYIDDVGVPDKV